MNNETEFPGWDPDVLQELREKSHLALKHDLANLLSPKTFQFAMDCIDILTVDDATLADLLPFEVDEENMRESVATD